MNEIILRKYDTQSWKVKYNKNLKNENKNVQSNMLWVQRDGEKKLSNFEKSTSIKSGISKKERSVSAGMAWEEGKDWLGLKTSSTML